MDLGAVPFEAVPLLVDEDDARAVQDWLGGYLLGALRHIDELDVAVEAHVAGGRFLPSFEARIGPHAFVVHIDRRIA